MDQLSQTLDLIKKYNWTCVLLQPRSKRPKGQTWVTTSDLSVILEHLHHGGNLGLTCGNVAVLDFDDLPAMRRLMEELTPLPIAVHTGSGKIHCYVQYESNLPARIYLDEKVVGEVQRGPRQQVVIPPSIHPDTGQEYRWAKDIEVPILPDVWRQRLLQGTRPDFIPRGSAGVPDWGETDGWDGPAGDEVQRLAMLQPGARMRRDRVKFQCPGCATDGRDRSKDNATVFPDGKWGCAVNRDHVKAIAKALGFLSDEIHRPEEIESIEPQIEED